MRARVHASPVSRAPWHPCAAPAVTVRSVPHADLRVARASHILLKGFDEATVAQMNAWKAEINNDPEKFSAIAQNSSLCPSRVKGGDLGFFTRGKMVKEFDRVVFTSEPGAVYGPVRTDFGHHLIYLHSCRSP